MIVELDPDVLREDAKECELNALSARDRGDELSAAGFAGAAVALLKIADRIEEAA